MRLIDADALQKVFEDMANDKWNKKTSTTWGRVFEESVDIVDEQPTIEERKRGHWINDKGLYRCSVCNDFSITGWADCIPIEQMNKAMKFCNNCGADMRGENNG